MIKKLLLVLVFCIISCENGKEVVPGKTDFQRNRNISFQDASSSPLKPKDLKSFKGLSFYDVDSSYVVNAELKLLPKPISEFLLTSTEDKRNNKNGIY